MRLLHWARLHRSTRAPATVVRAATPSAAHDTLVKPSRRHGKPQVVTAPGERPQSIDAADAWQRAQAAGFGTAHAKPFQTTVSAAFGTMPPARREAFVHTLLPVLQRIEPAQWSEAAKALGEARRTHTADAAWTALSDALLCVVDCGPVHDWDALVRGLATASPMHRERLLHAVKQLRDTTSPDRAVAALPETLPSEVRANWVAFVDQLRACGPMAVAERTEAVQALARLDEDTWNVFAGTLHAMSEGIAPNAPRSALMRAVSVLCATRHAQARQTLVRAALRLCTQRMDASARAKVLIALTPMHVRDCDAMPTLCAPLMAEDLAARDLAMNIVLLAETPADARASHRDRLLAAARARRHPNHRVDLENVSVYARIAQAARAVEVLQRHVGHVDRDDALRAMRRQLDAWQTQPETCPPALLRPRGHDTELANARRTLFGQRRPHDYSEALQQNQGYHVGEHVVGLGDLCAQVWTGMARYLDAVDDHAQRTRERDNLYASFFAALAQCIEDDGHRVCAVGISQRLLQVLQGYIDNIEVDVPTPQGLVCALTEALRNEAEEPSETRLARFVQEAQARADELYGDRGDDLATFNRHLRAYLRMTYAFEMPR